jgi:hypothetical protein
VAGAVGLEVLSGVHQRAEELVKLQRKIEAYRQVQHDTTTQLYSVASALVSADERTLSSTLRQLNQFGYDVDWPVPAGLRPVHRGRDARCRFDSR